jgi:ABC-2 type transport system permease protein
MPIYEQSYRRWEARGPLHQFRFLPITREALRLLLARKAFLALLIFAWLPFVIMLAVLYFSVANPGLERAMGGINAQFFGGFFKWQVPFVTLISVFGGAGLVANDLRSGGILVYLSRPLSRRDYILGKVGVLVALNLAITLVPGLALYVVGLSLAPEKLLKWDLWWIGPAIALQSLVIVFAVGLLVLAVSAVSRSARVTGVALIALWGGLELVQLFAAAVFGRREVSLLSVQANVRAVGNALFGIQQHPPALFWVWPALVLALTALACVAILNARVRAVEVVR